MSERLTKRTVTLTEKRAYSGSTVFIEVSEEYQLGSDTLKPGDKFRLKQKRGVFTFRRVAHNTATGARWVDCYDPKTGFFRSFHLDQIKSVVKPRRKRAIKTKVAYIGK